MSASFNTNIDKAMTTEQFTQVVDAILNGKYSWACVLILRFAGYNPLHYIPYRTFNRLMKENSLSDRTNSDAKKDRLLSQYHSAQPVVSPLSTSKIRDLNYLEPLTQSSCNPKGGSRIHWLEHLL
jgi:hypothetical protein